MQTRNSSLLCINHTTLTDWIFPVLLMTKKNFYVCFHNYEYGFDIHFLTMYMIFIHSQSLVDHLTGLL